MYLTRLCSSQFHLSSCLVPGLRNSVLNEVDELLTELEAVTDEVSSQDLEHINANKVILTLGHFRTVKRFLKQAAQGERKFQVIVVENRPPGFKGQEMTLSLAKVWSSRPLSSRPLSSPTLPSLP